MQKEVQILTPNKSIITFTLASTWIRLVAGLVDFVVIWLLLITASFIIGNIEFLMILVYISLLAYPFLIELITHGQSVGKLIMGIKVVQTNGQAAQYYHYFIRWGMMIIDYIVTALTLGIILMLSTDKNQRFGDILADTMVINKRTSAKFNLQKLMAIQVKTQETEITLPNLHLLHEEDVLLAKQLISHHTIYTHQVLTQLHEQMALKIQSILKIQSNLPPREFLYQVLVQYIAFSKN